MRVLQFLFTLIWQSSFGGHKITWFIIGFLNSAKTFHWTNQPIGPNRIFDISFYLMGRFFLNLLTHYMVVSQCLARLMLVPTPIEKCVRWDTPNKTDFRFYDRHYCITIYCALPTRPLFFPCHTHARYRQMEYSYGMLNTE